MSNDVFANRAEPDPAFADRLERLLVQRLDVPVAVPTSEWSRDYTDIEADITHRIVTDVEMDDDHQHRPLRLGRRMLVGLVVAAALVAGLVVVVQLGHRESDDRPGESVGSAGLIAFVGGYEPVGPPRAWGFNFLSDIYVVEPDGTGLRAMTSTADQNELSPSWSPDGSRLAFLRDVHRGRAQLVIVDPYTGLEELQTTVPMHENTDPAAPMWTPDGRSIVVQIGNDLNKMIDLDTQQWTVFPQGLSFSPDGKEVLVPVAGTLILVPSQLLADLQYDSTGLPPGARVLQQSADPNTVVGWTPNSSALTFTTSDNRIDVMTIADGRRRTLLDDASHPTWSPTGDQIAFLRRSQQGVDAEVWVASANGSDARQVATSSIAPTWSPDGAVLLLKDEGGLFTVRPDGTGRKRPDQNWRFEPADFYIYFEIDATKPPQWPIDSFGPAWQRIPTPPAMG